MKKVIVMVSLIVLVFAGISGCAFFNKMVTNDKLITQLAVNAATARVLHQYPSWKVNAINITNMAISAIDSKATVQLADAEKFIVSKISWSKMTPEEQALLLALISEVNKNLTDTFQAQGISDPGKQMLEVRQVLVWINDTAKIQ